MVYIGTFHDVGPTIAGLSNFGKLAALNAKRNEPRLYLASSLLTDITSLLGRMLPVDADRCRSKIGPRILMLEAQIAEVQDVYGQSSDWQYYDDEVDDSIKEALILIHLIISFIGN
jgi:hypothetical protein